MAAITPYVFGPSHAQATHHHLLIIIHTQKKKMVCSSLAFSISNQNIVDYLRKMRFCMHNQYSIANGLNFGCNVHVCGDHITWLSPYDRKMCGCHKMPVQPHAIYHRRRYLRCKRISKFGSTLCTPKIFVYHQDRIITMFTFICIYTFVFNSFFFFV